MNFRHIICLVAIFGVVFGVAAASGQWTKGMDDDAGKAAVTSRTDLPAADYEGARKIYPKRDRLFTTSLDGTWAFKLVKGLDTPDEMKGWNEPGYDTREWDDIAVPGNWETQGLKSPKDIKMKGSFKVYNTSPEPIDADVVPDLIYTHHYGF